MNQEMFENTFLILKNQSLFQRIFLVLLLQLTKETVVSINAKDGLMLAQDHFLKGVNRKSNSGGKVIFHSADSSKNEVHDIVQFSIITKTINFMIKHFDNFFSYLLICFLYFGQFASTNIDLSILLISENIKFFVDFLVIKN